MLQTRDLRNLARILDLRRVCPTLQRTELASRKPPICFRIFSERRIWYNLLHPQKQQTLFRHLLRRLLVSHRPTCSHPSRNRHLARTSSVVRNLRNRTHLLQTYSRLRRLLASHRPTCSRPSRNRHLIRTYSVVRNLRHRTHLLGTYLLRKYRLKEMHLPCFRHSLLRKLRKI